MNSSAARAVSLAVSGIEHDPARIALDEADVGEVEAAHLVDLVRHDFIEAIGHVQHGLPLQRRMNALEILALQQPRIAAHVPGDVAGVGHDFGVGRLGDEAFLGLVEIPLVLEGQSSGDALAQFDGVNRRLFALGVEMFLTRVRRLRLRNARVEGERASERDDGARCDYQSAEWSGGFHVVLPCRGFCYVSPLPPFDGAKYKVSLAR